MCLQFLLLLEFSSSLLPLALPTLASVNSGHSVNSETVGAVSRMNSNTRSSPLFKFFFFFFFCGIDWYELLTELLKHPCQQFCFFFFLNVGKS